MCRRTRQLLNNTAPALREGDASQTVTRRLHTSKPSSTTRATEMEQDLQQGASQGPRRRADVQIYKAWRRARVVAPAICDSECEHGAAFERRFGGCASSTVEGRRRARAPAWPTPRGIRGVREHGSRRPMRRGFSSAGDRRNLPTRPRFGDPVLSPRRDAPSTAQARVGLADLRVAVACRAGSRRVARRACSPRLARSSRVGDFGSCLRASGAVGRCGRRWIDRTLRRQSHAST